ARGWIARTERAPEAQAQAPRVRAAGPALLPEQSAAVEAVTASLGRFGAFVLHGITGSGKTEVYLRLIERVLARGERALVLVPEIGLTPQLLGRFRERFEAPMAVLHSALTDHERLLAWREAFSGRAHIVLGTRSGVFAPVPQLGLIVVDEEHDASFKQHEGGFRYSGRDLAVMRARRTGVPVLLGSATPELETLHNGADAPLPQRCPQCGFALKPVGQGTQRIEETLGTVFPGASIARLDRDVVRGRGDLEEVMRRMSSGEARILVGTQMVTKGHDF